MSPKIEQFKDMARQARQDLFDQTHPIGRLSLVQCAMLGGDTLVTISLAGSLFFSISPEAADHKVLLYLLSTACCSSPWPSWSSCARSSTW